MARRRFFVDRVARGAAELHGDEAAHLTRVLRVETGQRYEISDNQRVYLAEVAAARKDRVEFRVIEELFEPASGPSVTLYAALIKFDRFEWIVEKATELGAARIVPVDTARCEKGLSEAAPKRLERWRRIARESSQQSRRARLPEIGEPMRLSTLPETGVLLDEDTGAPPLAALLPATALLVGPEGGWTDDERRACARQGWKAASLGPRILRAETAAIAALSVILHTEYNRK